MGSVSRGGSVGGCCTRSVLVEACLPATAQHADSGNLHGGALTCIAHAKDLFVEDCASMLREVHPEAATPTLSLLPLALANRTLLLTGDSVTRDTFHVLMRLIATSHEPRTRKVNPVGNLVSCHVWKSAFRLCLTEAGGDGGEPLKRQADGSLNRSECLRPHAGIGWWGINPSDVFACLTEMQVIGDNSVVISNFGLHHNDLRSLQRNMESFLAWRHASPTRPCIVWRETTPQHFASSDGTFQHGDGPCGAPATRSGARPVALGSTTRNWPVSTSASTRCLHRCYCGRACMSPGYGQPLPHIGTCTSH